MSKLRGDDNLPAGHMTVKEFAALHKKTPQYIMILIKKRRVFGAYQTFPGKRWYIGPPARIIPV